MLTALNKQDFHRKETVPDTPKPITDTKFPKLTICLLTSLDEALAQVRNSPTGEKINFTVDFAPYQLFPDFPETKDKNQWYLEEKHMGNPEGQRVYQEHMAALMAPLGVTPRFDGQMGNTLHAHRVIQYFQEEKGAETANALVDALYKRYFTQSMHPAADETLIESCVEAGIDEEEAKKVVGNKETGLRSAKEKLRTVAMDADAVPIVSVEGKKRDITMNGAKEVADYVKALETIAKESA